MEAAHLIDAAKKFADWLGQTLPTPLGCEHEESNDLFINVDREPIALGSGVYLFHFPQGDVFYIGKTKTKTENFSQRIWAHIGSAASTLETGERGFPRPRGEIASRLEPDDLQKFRRGQFRVDYLKITPPELAALFEVYLQSFCFRIEGKLPKCNAQFG
jgi:hypothetical protein